MGKIANPIKRLVGFLIDIVICIAPVAYFGYGTVSSRSIYAGLDTATLGLTVVFVWSVAWTLLDAFLTARLGGTLGKMIVNTKVVNHEGKRISFYRALFRQSIGYTVSGSIAYLGFIWILIDKKNHRGWHDLVAGTYVVDA